MITYSGPVTNYHN